MSQDHPKPANDAKRKDAITVLLLLFLVATFAGSYYVIMQRGKEIHDMNETVVQLTNENAGLKATARQLSDTVASMEGGGSANSRRGKPLTHEYQPGAIETAYRAFQTIRARMEQPPLSPEDLEARIATDDLNGSRGPELAEIQCFEELIGPEGSPFLRTIFESNAEEVKFSGDIGMAGTFAPGLENLLAFYVTVGEPASLAFLEELLTNQIAQVARTKFDGNYFTFASEPIGAALDECASEDPAAAEAQAETPTEEEPTPTEPPAETESR